MIRPVVFRPEAEVDLLSARDWYDKRREGLGDEFANAVEELVAQISESHELYAMAFRQIRRAKLRRFPYVVYYREFDDRIEVIATLHGNRDPRTWQKRI